ncbi:aspartic peptidase domain-containing protein [Cercophora newfieldiana]|uniref:Probable aspartic-type endopeptidase OPSB n=1 Tax=Cercophora newfieldiana TaxID=92897 RepID=A0AA39Y6H9_9PEZI|nr:aspartic peptidase domain-containing protein [Cercophora newfieldiana]
MKTSTTLAVAASLLLAVEGLAVEQRQNGPKVVGMETVRIPARNPVHRDKLRRRGTVEVGLDNEETLYFINATVGTPARSVRLHIDTGSSDLWVNTPSSSLCRESSRPCQFAGTYSANSSSTYEYIGSWFNISYVDGSGASGDYVSDTVSFGSSKLDRLQFGIGYNSTNAQGILGIGYPINEVQVGRAGKQPYRNLPAQMVADGMIQSNAYSLWLNDLDANTGNILFGGIDNAKFNPPLLSVPIQPEQGFFAEFLITLTGATLSGTSVASDSEMALAVLLDTGSSLTYLPDDMVSTIYNRVGAQYDSSNGAAYVPCSLANEATTFTFSFSEPTITVDMNEMVLDMYLNNGKRPQFQDGTTACLFGIAPAGQGTNVLGDTFLRSAYVVYDLANNEISLAQTKFNTTASEVVEIGTGTNSVPGATKVSNPVAATEGISGPGVLNGIGRNAAGGRIRGGGSSAVGLVVAVGVAVGLML